MRVAIVQGLRASRPSPRQEFWGVIGVEPVAMTVQILVCSLSCAGGPAGRCLARTAPLFTDAGVQGMSGVQPGQDGALAVWPNLHVS